MFNVEKFLETLPTMALGMVGIFIVIFAIAYSNKNTILLFPIEGSGKIANYSLERRLVSKELLSYGVASD